MPNSDYYRDLEFMRKMDSIDATLDNVENLLSTGNELAEEANQSLSQIEANTAATAMLMASFVGMYAMDRALSLQLDQFRWEFDKHWDTWDQETRVRFLRELRETREKDRLEAEKKKKAKLLAEQEAREIAEKLESIKAAERAKKSAAALAVHKANRESALDEWNSNIRPKLSKLVGLTKVLQMIVTALMFVPVTLVLVGGFLFINGESDAGFVTNFVVTLAFGGIIFIPLVLWLTYLFQKFFWNGFLENMYWLILSTLIKSQKISLNKLEISQVFPLSGRQIDLTIPPNLSENWRLKK